MGLNLYAKLEPLIPYEHEIIYLYDAFIEKIEDYNPTTILDVGCGNGNFIKSCQNCGFDNIKGIDLSSEMVKIAQSKGVDATACDVAELQGEFDLITAVFDVLNYLDTASLKSFLTQIHRLLKPGGHFIADINTKFGFEEVAPGTLLLEKAPLYGAIDADYQNEILTTKLRLFSPNEENSSLFEMQEDSITQYFHPMSRFKKISPFSKLEHEPLYLYSDESDKTLLIFTK
jgi:2-polyprenyl-3-methyl-5-hydroxy-6-metoxy-1,4-benzoquinol methylase